MAMSITCDCGRTLRLKNEAPGQRFRCPSCSTALTVPQPEVSVDTEDEALQMLLEEPADQSHDIRRSIQAEPIARTESVQERPRPKVPATYPRTDPAKERAMPKPTRKPKAERGGLFDNVEFKPFLAVSGLVMFLVGGALFYLVFAAGAVRLSVLPLLLLFFGFHTFFKGLTRTPG